MKKEIFETLKIFIISTFIFLSISAICIACYYSSIDENAYWKEIYQEDYQDMQWKFFELEASYCRNEENEYFEKYCR